MFAKIKNLTLSDTSKDTAIVFVGTLINASVGGIFFILAPRLLGPSQYGLFAVVTSTGILIASLANFGIDTGILRFANQNNKILTSKILKLALQMYLSIGLVLLSIGLIISQPLALFLGNIELAPLLKISFIGLILILLTDFMIAILQSRKHFFKASLVNISSNVARLLVLGAGGYFFTIDVYFLTVLFFFIPIVSVITGKLFVPFDFLSAKGHQNQFRNFFSFNSWIAASLAISSVPVDNYLLVKFAGPIATGLYAAPYKILSIIDQLGGNFSRVLAPRFSSFKNDEEAKSYAKKAIPIVILVCAGILINVILAGPVVNLLFGSQYAQSVIIYQIVAIAFAFYFSHTIPVSLIVYYFGKPKITFLITVIIMICWTLFSFILIPRFQAVGAAIAELVAAITAFTLFYSYVIWKFIKKK